MFFAWHMAATLIFCKAIGAEGVEEAVAVGFGIGVDIDHFVNVGTTIENLARGGVEDLTEDIRKSKKNLFHSMIGLVLAINASWLLHLLFSMDIRWWIPIAAFGLHALLDSIGGEYRLTSWIELPFLDDRLSNKRGLMLVGLPAGRIDTIGGSVILTLYLIWLHFFRPLWTFFSY